MTKMTCLATAIASLCAINAPATFAGDIDTALNGTYLLSFAQSVHESGPYPYAAGEEVTIVINGTNDTLCVAGKLLDDAYADPTGGTSIFFDDLESDKFFAVSQLVDGSLNGVYVNQPTETRNIGAFRPGSKISDSLECVGAGTVDEAGDTFTENGLSVSVDVKNIFDLAAQLYPGVFKTPGLLREHEGYLYKFYRDTGAYIGFKDGKIYVLGGAFGNAITEYGAVSTILADLQQVQRDRLDLIEGDFKLTISGTVSTTTIVGPISVAFGGIVIENIPAPGPDDLDEILDILREEAQLQNLRNEKLTVINQTANRVTFDLEVTADVVASGVTTTSTYRLNYDYTK